MWVEKRKDHYRMYERYTDPLGETHKVSVRIERNTPQQRNKGQAVLDELIEKKRSFVYADLTFEQLAQFYLIEKKPYLKASTNRRNERECNAFNKLFGKVRVSDLSASLVRGSISKISSRSSAFNEHIKRFKGIINWGYVNDYVKDPSFIDKLTPARDKSRRQKVADKFMEKDECNLLLDNLPSSSRILAQFMILSGLRCGEALALTEDDLDFGKREISVTKTRDPITHQITPPKTPASIRQVYMQDALLALCATIRDDLDERPSVGNGEPKPLFWNGAGRPMEYRAFLKTLSKTSTRVLGRKITTHVLRHTHASLLAENKIDLEVISRRLGHEDSRITKEIYVHVTQRREEIDREELKKIDLI